MTAKDERRQDDILQRFHIRDDIYIALQQYIDIVSEFEKFFYLFKKLEKSKRKL